MNTGHRTGKIIDLALGMERLNATQEGSALEALRILFEMLKTDIGSSYRFPPFVYSSSIKL